MRHYGSARWQLGLVDVRQWRTDVRSAAAAAGAGASARNQRRRRWRRGDYTAIGIYWLQVLRLTERNGAVRVMRPSRQDAAAAEVVSWATADVDGCGCCRADRRRPEHLQPIDLRAISNDCRPLTGAERRRRRHKGRAPGRPAHRRTCFRPGCIAVDGRDQAVSARSVAEATGRIDTHCVGFV